METTDEQFPQYTGITGQSGGGKGTIIEMLCNLYEKNNVRYKLITNGPLFTEESKQQTPFGKRMKEIHHNGEFQPLAVSIATYFPSLKEAINEGLHIIHDGSPRQPGEAQILAGLLNSGYLKSMKVIQLWAEEETCAQRLKTRTEGDKRPDLSIEGHPGVADMGKIERKMLAWSKHENQIIKDIQSTKMKFDALINDCSIPELNQRLKICFGL